MLPETSVVNPTVVCTMVSAKAIEAVNSLRNLSQSYHLACLAVIEEFFTSHEELPADDSDWDDSDSEMEFDAPGISRYSYT